MWCDATVTAEITSKPQITNRCNCDNRLQRFERSLFVVIIVESGMAREGEQWERESGRKLLTYMLLICFHDLNVRLSPIGSTHTHKRTQTHANARTERQRERREENAREREYGRCWESACVCSRRVLLFVVGFFSNCFAGLLFLLLLFLLLLLYSRKLLYAFSFFQLFGQKFKQKHKTKENQK